MFFDESLDPWRQHSLSWGTGLPHQRPYLVLGKLRQCICCLAKCQLIVVCYKRYEIHL